MAMQCAGEAAEAAAVVLDMERAASQRPFRLAQGR
jgi:hypothetical protein